MNETLIWSSAIIVKGTIVYLPYEKHIACQDFF